MKMKLSVYLLKEKAEFDTCIKDEFRTLRKNEFLIKENNFESYRAKLITRESYSQPLWLNLFSDIKEVNLEEFKSRNLQGLLIIEFKSRLLCFTFGHARHLIKKSIYRKKLWFKNCFKSE